MEATGIGSEHARAFFREVSKPAAKARGWLRLVPDVSGEHDVDISEISIDQVGDTDFDRYSVRLCIQLRGDRSERIDVDGSDVRSPGASRGDGDETAAATEIQNACIMHALGVVQNVSRERLATGPWDAPKRNVGVVIVEPARRLEPERRDGARGENAELRNQRNFRENGAVAHESRALFVGESHRTKGRVYDVRGRQRDDAEGALFRLCRRPLMPPGV